jgi:eukaryotic-like serine/threonine-protein kinase
MPRVIAGRYSLDSEIGRGGMGVVWRGEDQVLGRDVALKRIGLAPGGASPDLLRAEREARLAATLNHPNVVAVFDLVVEKDEHWLVMEHVESRDLAALVRKEGPLDADRAAALLAQAADALAAAHAAGIVHRDVKPSNMLVTPQGRVKLTDFGIARTSQDATLTQTGLVTGSPAYLAPEVAAGSPATTASDVWSLGATLYHALAGTPPYEVKDNMVAALYRIVHEDPPKLSDAGWLAPVLEATMARDPEARWSMVQVRDFLLAGPDGAPTQRLAAGAAATAPLATSAATAPATADADDDDADTTTGTAGSTSTPPRIAPTPRDRRRLTGWLVGGAAVMLAAILIWIAVGSGDDATEPQADRPAASEPAEPSPTPDSESSPPEAPSEEEMVAFARDYVPAAVSDRDTSWQQLTPGFQQQSGGRSGYDAFWSTIEEAEVRDISADPEAMTVSYTVRYERTDGSTTSPENVTLQLVEQQGRLLIADEL